jgi:tetratricopeptide (TPR) repeat protein
MSESWYRNTEWTPQIAAEFNAKLARSRSQKAQYLRIQGSILASCYPEAALELLQRCIELEDEMTLAAVYQDAAYAHYRMGDIDLALQSLEAAIERQEVSPMTQAEAPYDYCMLVALHGCNERYDRVLALVIRIGSGPFPLTHFKAQAANTFILWERGRQEEAKAAARLAIEAQSVEPGWVPGYPDVGTVPEENPLSSRLAEIAASD